MVKLQIEYLPPDALKPYGKNARVHDADDVQALEDSIEEFDFSDPIGIWGPDNLIVEGHGRLLAAKKAGLTEVPVIRLDHLTEEQQRAYRLAHNRTAELSVWDEATKKTELKAIKNLNMLEFGFSVDEMYDFGMDKEENAEETDGSEGETSDNDGGYYGDERERTFNAYNLGDYDPEKTVSPYDLPTLKKCDYIPQALMGFNEVLTTKDFSKGVHFFLDDYQFERVWVNPEKYIYVMKDFPCVLTPDFSLYADMPMAMKIWNVYRSRLIGQKMQSYGLNVIPTLQYAGPETHSWCFEGIEGGGTVAVSTVGVMRDKDALHKWSAGMEAAIEKIQPKTVVCYGVKPDFDFGKVETIFIQARKFA